MNGKPGKTGKHHQNPVMEKGAPSKHEVSQNGGRLWCVVQLGVEGLKVGLLGMVCIRSVSVNTPKNKMIFFLLRL